MIFNNTQFNNLIIEIQQSRHDLLDLAGYFVYFKIVQYNAIEYISRNSSKMEMPSLSRYDIFEIKKKNAHAHLVYSRCNTYI